MPLTTVKTYHRGSCVKVVISVLRSDNDFSTFATDPIVVNNMAVVILKGKSISESKEYLMQSIEFKKYDITKDSTVVINITSNDFEKQFFCQDEPIAVPMNLKGYDSRFLLKPTIFLYVIETNITVHVKTPVACGLCKEIYEETEFTDFKLQAEDGCVPVHKSVLFVHGEMFRGMLRGTWKETEEDRMNMPGVTLQTLKHLKDYMYLGTLPDEGLEPLLVVAKRCLMDSLATSCIEKLVSTVKVENFDGLVEFACQNNIPELVRGLVLRIPDTVVNGISKIDKQKSNVPKNLNE